MSAPLPAGKIEFGVINQSSSAFNHILNDVSLVVYQFETLAGFSAVIDRLGEFQEVVDVRLRHKHPRVIAQRQAASRAASLASADGDADADAGLVLPSSGDGSGSDGTTALPGIQVVQLMQPAGGNGSSSSSSSPLLELDGVSISTPDGAVSLVQQLSLAVSAGRSLLIMGPSGAGKTSVLRALAGLWNSGRGTIYSHGLPGLGDPGAGAHVVRQGSADHGDVPGGSSSSGSSGSMLGAGGDGVLFLPQRPYMVLGSLRDQLLYPTWARNSSSSSSDGTSTSAGSGGSTIASAPVRDAALHAVGLELCSGTEQSLCS